MANPRNPLSRLTRRLRLPPTRHSSSQSQFQQRQQLDPYAILSTPTWSVRALLPPQPTTTTTQPPTQPPHNQKPTPPSKDENQQQEITPQTLSHLLRLSALPQPTTPAQTNQMLSTLHAQLHFVRNIQRVNTTGIPPLSSIRDETPEGLREATIGVETLQHALKEEEVYGRCKRPRRRRGGKVKVEKGVEDWDVLGCAAEKVGRYYVVRSAGNGNMEGTGEGVAGKDGE